MVLNSRISNIVVIIRAGTQIVICCSMSYLKTFKWTIINYHLLPEVEDGGTHLKCFSVTVFISTAKFTQKHIIRLTFMLRRFFYICVVCVVTNSGVC
jgi:hypothetical protein